MAKTTLSEQAIKEAKAAGKRYLWELLGHGKGSLGVYIGKSGIKYIYKYSVGGTKEEQVTIGTGEDLTLKIARKKAEEYLDKREKGEELVSYKAERIAKERRDLRASTFGEHFRTYLEKRKERKDFSPKYAHDVELMYKKHLDEKLGAAKISSIKASTVKGIINDSTTSVARFLYTFLGPFFEWCVDQEYRTVSPLESVKRPEKAEARDRILNEAEIKALWICADKLHDPRSGYENGYPFGPMLKLLLLTGQRRDEVAGMRWDEMDRAKGEWIIPKKRTKNGKEHVVHLSEQARIILNSLPIQKSLYVFTTTLSSHVSGYSKMKERLDKLMHSELDKEIEDWRVHDLRRTAASAMRGLRVQKDTIELILNHTSGERGGLVGVYQRHELLDERIAALNVLGDYIERLVSPTDAECAPHDNVIRLRG
jgi:integrase